MMGLPSLERMYRALLESDASFEGVFLVGVKTTGIFCRPTCPARKPLAKNVEYFACAREAVFAGYRPCKRCRPLEKTLAEPDWVRRAIEIVEAEPDRRVRDGDLRSARIAPERIRRYFKTNYGMTFHAYARGRRLGQAFSLLRNGVEVIEAGMEAGFESTSGFREAFAKAFGRAPSQAENIVSHPMRWLETPLGPMVASAGEKGVLLLEFVDRRMLPVQLETLQKRLRTSFHPGTNAVLDQLARELEEYFAGDRRSFEVPLHAPGTPFQERVWAELQRIPYGETMSYATLAAKVGSPDAQRAVGKANGDNRIAIVIPCHRVIRSDGTLCGYGGGLWRKKRLLELESGQFSF